MEKVFLMVKGIFAIPGFVSFLGIASLVAIILAMLIIALGRKSTDKLWAKIALSAVTLVTVLSFLIYMFYACRFILIFVYKFVPGAETPIPLLQAIQHPTPISIFLVFAFFLVLISFPLLVSFCGPILTFFLWEFQGMCMYERGMRLIEEGKKDAAKKIITDYEEEVTKLSRIDKWLALPTGLRLLKNKLEMSV